MINTGEASDFNEIKKYSIILDLANLKQKGSFLEEYGETFSSGL